jgi:hypothetical protein
VSLESPLSRAFAVDARAQPQTVRPQSRLDDRTEVVETGYNERRATVYTGAKRLGREAAAVSQRGTARNREPSVSNRTDIDRQTVHSKTLPRTRAKEPTFRGSSKDRRHTMFGFGILGTLLVICLIVWLVRRA